MKSLILLIVLILGSSFVAKAESLQPVEVDVQSVKIIDQKELGARRFELTIEFNVNNPGCIEEFVGLVRSDENTFMPVAKISKFCTKPLFNESKTAKIEVGIYTKSLPAREILKLGKTKVWLEEDFGNVSIAR